MSERYLIKTSLLFNGGSKRIAKLVGLGSEGWRDGLGAGDHDHDSGWKNPHIMSALLLQKGKYEISYYQVSNVLTSSGPQNPSSPSDEL